jgi:O-antigen/teichoic acid export membrane protein
MKVEKTKVRPNISDEHGLGQRLMRGIGATAMGPIVNAIVQLSSVPVLLHFWGATKYGDWLLLSAVPTYLTLSDFGFGDASGSDMSMRVAANDKEGALRTFQSSWVLVTSVSIVTFLLTLVFLWWVPWQRWLRISSISNHQAATVMIVLCGYVLVSQQNGITESGYRSDGHFATGTFWMGILRLVEAGSAVVVAALGGELLAVAVTYLAVRCAATLGYILLLRHVSPWVRYGVRHARLSAVRTLAAPAFGFMALPLGSALSLQGLILVIGATLGPIAVVSFSTLRTLSRLNSQVINAVKIALWPELSRAFGAHDISLARKLHRRICQVSLTCSILGGIVLWFLGPLLYRLWIRQSVAFDANCFHVLLLVVVTNSFWDTSSVVALSLNAHCRIALTYSAAAAFSLGLAWFLVPPLGLVGAAMALFATDGWMTGLVLRTSLYHVQDSFRKFVSALFSVPRFRQIFEPVSET